jgi:hypothetical protein
MDPFAPNVVTLGGDDVRVPSSDPLARDVNGAGSVLGQGIEPARLGPRGRGATSVIQGGCLCGGVRFEISRAVGPFEFCHCPRCRKASGSAFAAGLGVRTEDFRLTSGAELIRVYEAPIRESPPAYRVAFCSRCGSPVPSPPADSSWFEIPAGALDADPRLRPDKHIFVECKSEWFQISDALPRFTKAELAALRRAREGARSQAGGAGATEPRSGAPDVE